MIDTKEISVVVQGAIDKVETPITLKSIRKYLPNAEIILSTWENSDVSGLDYDILVENQDPGTVLIDTYKSKEIYNNINRQLLSTQEGLKKVNRKYVLKLRSDLILTSDKFLNCFEKFQARSEEYNLFSHKVLIPMLFTRLNIKLCCSKTRYKIPFHISDWWFFGLTTDIKKYFENTPLVEEPDFTNYFKKEENRGKCNPYGKISHKFAPEQYYALSAFGRNFEDIYMEDAADYSDDLIEKFRKCLLNNFVILDFKQSGIYLNKYSFSKSEKLIGDQYIDLYNSYRFQKDYKEICDNDFVITEKPVLEDKKTYAKMRIYKHYYRVNEPQMGLFKRLESLLVSLPLAIIKYLIQLMKTEEKCSKI